MSWFIDFIKMMPATIQIIIAALILGIGLAYAHETRYMTVSDYTKSYVLDLKKLIRDYRHDLEDDDLTPRERQIIEDEIEALLDELCYEKPSDRMCKPWEDE